MARLAKLQLIGPFALALTIIAAELAAYWLNCKPSSELAWYLNLTTFGIFQRSHSVLSEHFGIPYLQLLFVATPILLLAYGGFALRLRLPAALASNLSCAYVFFLMYACYGANSSSTPAASLAATAYRSVVSFSALNFASGPQAFTLSAVLIPSLLSFAASHLLYFRAVRER